MYYTYNTGYTCIYISIRSLTDPSNTIGFFEPEDIDLADQCFPKPVCDSTVKYRTINGSCNNLLFPIWGQSNSANTRIIQADYSDGTIKINIFVFKYCSYNIKINYNLR